MARNNMLFGSLFDSCPATWDLVPFEEAVDFQEGPGIMAVDFQTSGVPLIRLSGVQRSTASLDGCNFLNPEKVAKKWNHFRLKRGDLIISSSASFGLVSEIGLDTEGAIPYTGLIRLRPRTNKVLPGFIKYFASSSFFKQQVEGMAAGSVLRHFGPSHLRKMTFPLPTLQEQDRIAKILSSLDDKIELNRRMNATLEAMARALFKAWFVDFEPVHANKENRPSTSASPEIAKLFPSEFENGIPKGWQRKIINQLAKNIQYGFTQSSTSENVGPKFLRITDIQRGRISWDNVPFCEISETDYEKYKIQHHDIFIARTGASTGENVYVIDSPEAVFASYLIRVQFDDPALAFYIGKFFRGIEYFDYVASILGGSAQPNANAQKLTSVEVSIPSRGITKAYFTICYPFEQKKSSNGKENIKLSEIRDSLLQKLMSGEISTQHETYTF